MKSMKSINNCPRGYSMSAQGVCTQSLGGDSPLAHSPGDCNDCIDQCVAQSSHCSGAHSHPPGGCNCNRQCANYNYDGNVCNEPGFNDDSPGYCTDVYTCTEYIYYCWGGDNCMNQCYWECQDYGGGYSGPGGGGGRTGGYGGDHRTGGRIRRRRR